MPRPRSFDETAVLERARDLFWERGYTATSINDLEEHLGIKRSSLYRTYGGKRQLYDRTLATYQSDNLNRLRKALLDSDDLRRDLIVLFTSAARRVDTDCATGSRGCYIVNATTEMAAGCPVALQFVSDNRERFVAILQEALAGAQVKGQLEAGGSEAFATYLFVLYNGLQVVVQTGVERDALVAAVETGIGRLPWTR